MKTVWPYLLLVTLAIVCGGLLRPQVDRLFGWGDKNLVDADSQSHQAHGAVDEHKGHVALTPEAVESLGLIFKKVELGDYQQTVRIPAEIAEIPGVSNSKLSSPVHGVVTQVLVRPGAAVSPGEIVVRVRLIDERVIEAQLDLLESVTQLEIVADELARLSPLAEAGSVAKKKQIDLEYERRRLRSRMSLKRQELVVRGIPPADVTALEETGQIVDAIEVKAPRQLRVDMASSKASTEGQPTVGLTRAPDSATVTTFVIERLLVHPGQIVARGATLCDLANHEVLYILGHAFETEIDAITAAVARGQSVAAEFGTNGLRETVEDLSVEFVANTVDADTQTFPVFVALTNKLVHQSERTLAPTWRYKVAQRGHLVIPTKKIENQLVVPREAVVFEGPDAYVFRVHRDDPHSASDPHAHAEDESDAHDHDDHVEDEDHSEVHNHDAHAAPAEDFDLEPVPVVVLHRDDHWLVLKLGGNLRQGDVIAHNHAYQLQLARKSAMETGGNAHQGHNH